MSGHKAVLANEYRKIISKEAESKAGMKAINARWHGNEYDSETFTESYKEKEETDTRKLAAEHMHVSERKVREVQGIFA